VVGAGFCGTLLAIHAARLGMAVTLVERGGRFGPGLAYGAAGPLHLLNTPAGRMSAFADEPEHFVRWAQGRGLAVSGGSFLPRSLYGEYLAELLRGCPEGQVRCRTGQVVAVAPGGVRLGDGGELRADRVALCPGNLPRADIAEVGWLRGDPRYVGDPWRMDAARLDRAAPVMLLGSGLTGLDIAITLAAAGQRGTMHLVSRHGLLPQAHRTAAQPGSYATPEVASWPASARGMLAALRREVRVAAAAGFDWREVIASLRGVTQGLWRRLGERERERFVRHLRPYWDSHRHRAAPETARAIAELQAAGRLQVHAGRVAAVEDADDGLVVTLVRGGSRRSIAVGALINCTGPAADLRRCDDPLLCDLLDRGLARLDPLGLGLVADDDGRLIGADGASSGLWLAGPLRRGALWEGTAVLELAEQVAALATALRADCP
jgi:uncharacterized NAD(P)/FAD-binding protein YdhS